MCGRFTQMMSWSQVHDLYRHQEPVAPLPLAARYNGAPTQDFAACRLDEAGRRTVVKLRWGLVPSWAKDVRIGFRLINARSETVHSKPSFAGLWERWSGPADARETFTIITTAAFPDLAEIHHRQPAIVDPARFDGWLNPESPVSRLLDLVREPYIGPYEKRAVSTLVNNVRNNHPDILDSAPERRLF